MTQCVLFYLGLQTGVGVAHVLLAFPLTMTTLNLNCTVGTLWGGGTEGGGGGGGGYGGWGGPSRKRRACETAAVLP